GLVARFIAILARLAGLGRRVLLVLLFLGALLGFLGEIALTDVLAVADAEHHDDVVRLLLMEDVAGDVPPVEVVLGIVAQQAGVQLVLAQDRDLGRIREGVLETVGEPVGHAVAHDDDRRRRRYLIGLGVGLARRRGAGTVDRGGLAALAGAVVRLGRILGPE